MRARGFLPPRGLHVGCRGPGRPRGRRQAELPFPVDTCTACTEQDNEVRSHDAYRGGPLFRHWRPLRGYWPHTGVSFWLADRGANACDPQVAASIERLAEGT